jgi:hypothetical protein
MAARLKALPGNTVQSLPPFAGNHASTKNWEFGLSADDSLAVWRIPTPFTGAIRVQVSDQSDAGAARRSKH